MGKRTFEVFAFFMERRERWSGGCFLFLFLFISLFEKLYD
jgi:hypothetical protein